MSEPSIVGGEAPIVDGEGPTKRLPPKELRCKQCGDLFTEKINEDGTVTRAIVFIKEHYLEKHPETYDAAHKAGMSRRAEESHQKTEHETPETEEEAPLGETAPKPRTIKAGLSEEDERVMISMEGRPALNRLKRERLVSVLSKAPRMGSQSVKWILDRWDNNDRIKDDPNALWSLMVNEAQVSPQIARSILEDVWSLEQKYASILAQQGQPPIFLGGSQGPQQPSVFPSGPYVQYPSYQPQYGLGYPYHTSAPVGYPPYGYYPPPSPQPTQEKQPQVTLEAMRAEIKKAMEEQLGKVDIVEIEEPARDSEGRIILDPDNRPILVKRRGPASSLQGDKVLEYLKFGFNLREGGKEKGGGEAQIPEALTTLITNMQKDQADMRTELRRTKDEAQADRIKALEDSNKELREDIRHGGWHSDTGRVIGEFTKTAEKIAQDRRPFDKAVEIVFPPVSPAEKKQAAGGSINLYDYEAQARPPT